MKFFSTTGAVLLPLTASLVNAIDLKVDDEASIKSVCRQYAYGLMSEYKNNVTGIPEQDIGIFPKPHYWWAAGAAWGGMIEYTQLTGDESHVKTLQQALVSNYGPDKNILLPWRKDQTGNDDQAFWALAVMSALESKFPEPENAPATYLEVATNAFNNIVSRWDEANCGGGLKWQVYPENAYGWNYKNSISNGGAFALGARLARYTGNTTYSDWAEKIYEWTKSVGLIGEDWQVFDGTDDKEGCAKINDKTEWSYNNAMYMHGSAFMFDVTKGNKAWQERVAGMLTRSKIFFGATDTTKEIMYEPACETGKNGRKCNLDQQSFKAYLARWMAQTAVLAPFTKDEITKYLKASAVGASKSCSGGDDKVTCGSKWYTGSWDDTRGVGQQLSALEVTQALLTVKNNVIPAKSGDQPQDKPKDEKPKDGEQEQPKENPDDKKPEDQKPQEPKPEQPKPEEPKPEEPKPESPAPTPAPAQPPQCTCTGPTTVTVWVPPTTDVPAPPAPPTEQPPPPPYGNGTVPPPPPGNGTNGTTPPPEEFQGAAGNLQVTITSILSAAALAVLVGLL